MKRKIDHTIRIKKVRIDDRTKFEAVCSCRKYRSKPQSTELMAVKIGNRHKEDKS